MKPFVIKNESQCAAALAHVETLMDAAPGSEEEVELEVWAALVEQYEDKAHGIPLPYRIDASSSLGTNPV